jgi:hypothetical protein
VLPKLVQNALCIIEMRAVRLIYIIIRYETSLLSLMTYCDPPRPFHSPLLPRLGQTHYRCLHHPSPYCYSPHSLLLYLQGPYSKQGPLLQPLQTGSICPKLGGALCAKTEGATRYL